jgi:UDP-2-acetamido-2,6-beta-L-arabino-hexul-4-ose reductase
MRVLITGADGFISKTLQVRLAERGDIESIPYTRASNPADLPDLIRSVDAVIHLAGVNRPVDPAEFQTGNVDLTRLLVEHLQADGRALPIIVSSSAQAVLDNPYGRSKSKAEQAVTTYAALTGARAYIYRLPNVFGKWARPNYNSAIATFSHNIAQGLPISINDPAVKLRLVYVDDVVDEFIRILLERPEPVEFPSVPIEYESTVGDIADALRSFNDSREDLTIPAVGTGFMRALYSTYVSYLPPDRFTYRLTKHADARGEFVEMLKTENSGQFSFFTAHAGVTRGGHYHHTKTEKFLVIRGKARFKFRHILDGSTHELFTNGDEPEIVETVPGWTHDITNVGDHEMIVMLWANEIFDRQRPDTIAAPV